MVKLIKRLRRIKGRGLYLYITQSEEDNYNLNKGDKVLIEKQEE